MSNNITKFREKKGAPLTGEEQAPCKEQGSKQKKPMEEASLDLQPHVNCLVEETCEYNK